MDQKESPVNSRPVLLVGAGQRPNELGAVLAALGAVRARMGGDAQEPHRPLGLEDLEELLAARPTEGTLILDYERVPGEDIGFVRRFLERHPGWRTVILGESAEDRRARALLALPGTEWLPWPPDLDQIGALLFPGPGSRPARASIQESPLRPALRVTRETDAAAIRAAAPALEPSNPRAGREPVDVGRLLEELVAAATLGAESNPAFLFRCDAPLPIRRERSAMAEPFASFLTLARICGGQGEVISAQADPSPTESGPSDRVRLQIDFPRGALRPAPEPLPSEEWTILLEPGAGDTEPTSLGSPLGLALTDARRGADLLRAIGARVFLRSSRPDRLRLDLFLASEPLGPVEWSATLENAAPPPAPEDAMGEGPDEPELQRAVIGEDRLAKAEDPFA